MFDEGFAKRHGVEVDSIVEEITDQAGTSDAHCSVLLAAAHLLMQARKDNKDAFDRGVKAGRICDSILLPWWRKDRYGWPIEQIKGRSAFWFWLRVVFQNIRKITG